MISGLASTCLLEFRLPDQLVVLCVRDLSFLKANLRLSFDLEKYHPPLALGPVHIYRCLHATQVEIYLGLALGFALRGQFGLGSLHDTSGEWIRSPQPSHSEVKGYGLVYVNRPIYREHAHPERFR